MCIQNISKTETILPVDRWYTRIGLVQDQQEVKCTLPIRYRPPRTSWLIPLSLDFLQAELQKDKTENFNCGFGKQLGKAMRFQYSRELKINTYITTGEMNFWRVCAYKLIKQITAGPANLVNFSSLFWYVTWRANCEPMLCLDEMFMFLFACCCREVWYYFM